MENINLLAVLICGIVSIIIGSVWYGPLFGKAWMKEVCPDMTSKDMTKKQKREMHRAYLIQFLLSLLMAGVFSCLVNASAVAYLDLGLVGAVKTAFWIWLGIVVPVKAGDMLWAKKSGKLFVIDLGFWLIQLVVFGLIIAHFA